MSFAASIKYVQSRQMIGKHFLRHKKLYRMFSQRRSLRQVYVLLRRKIIANPCYTDCNKIAGPSTFTINSFLIWGQLLISDWSARASASGARWHRWSHQQLPERWGALALWGSRWTGRPVVRRPTSWPGCSSWRGCHSEPAVRSPGDWAANGTSAYSRASFCRRRWIPWWPAARRGAPFHSLSPDKVVQWDAREINRPA